MTTQTFNLELVPKGVPPIVHVSQYDKGQTWKFNILMDNQLYTIPSGSSVTVRGTKRDGTGFSYACAYSGSQVTVTEQQQMTVFAGDVTTELRIAKGSDIIATLNFIIRVEPAALSDDTVISETDIPIIEEISELIDQLPEIMEEMEGYSEDAEAWANGTRNGVPVGSSDPAYQKNAKWIADNLIGYVTDSQYSVLANLFAL